MIHGCASITDKVKENKNKLKKIPVKNILAELKRLKKMVGKGKKGGGGAEEGSKEAADDDGEDDKSDRKSTRLNSSHSQQSRMPSSA